MNKYQRDNFSNTNPNGTSNNVRLACNAQHFPFLFLFDNFRIEDYVLFVDLSGRILFRLESDRYRYSILRENIDRTPVAEDSDETLLLLPSSNQTSKQLQLSLQRQRYSYSNLLHPAVYKLWASTIPVLHRFCHWLNNVLPELRVRFHFKAPRATLKEHFSKKVLPELAKIWKERLKWNSSYAWKPRYNKKTGKTKNGKLLPSRYRKADQRAVEEYTGSSFGVMNRALRSGHSEDEFVQEKIHALIRAMNKPKLKIFHGTVYRGVGPDFPFKDELKPGATFSDPAFLSTSRLQGKAFASKLKGSILFIIESKTGVNVQPFAIEKNRHEAEVLFRPNTLFRIKSLEEPDSGRLVVRMDEIAAHTAL